MQSPNLQPALSPIQREILVGGMLGDWSIYRAKLTHNARLYVQQGAVHTEYLNHLYSVLQNLCSSGPCLRFSNAWFALQLQCCCSRLRHTYAAAEEEPRSSRLRHTYAAAGVN